MREMKKTGRCHCGNTRFEYEGPENWTGHCHCEDCRRVTASPFTSFLGVPNGKWSWTREQPKKYQSSPGVTRSFCRYCGTPMAFETMREPDEIHFYAATLDDQSDYRPAEVFHGDSRVPWIGPEDGNV